MYTVTIEVACTIHSYAAFSLALNLALENMVTLLMTIFHSNNLGRVKLMYLSTNI